MLRNWNICWNQNKTQRILITVFLISSLLIKSYGVLQKWCELGIQGGDSKNNIFRRLTSEVVLELLFQGTTSTWNQKKNLVTMKKLCLLITDKKIKHILLEKVFSLNNYTKTKKSLSWKTSVHYFTNLIYTFYAWLNKIYSTILFYTLQSLIGNPWVSEAT